MLVKKQDKRSDSTEIKIKLDELCQKDLSNEILITYHVFHISMIITKKKYINFNFTIYIRILI